MGGHESTVYKACIFSALTSSKILVLKFPRATLKTGVTQMQSDQQYAYDHNYGCRKFTVQLPRKALDIIKQRYGNAGALIRGLLAEELGEDWPKTELKISGPLDKFRLQLKVVRPRVCKRPRTPTSKSKNISEKEL